MTDIDLTDGNDKGRHVQPQGFVPSHLAEPALRDRSNRDTALEYAALELGEVRVMAALLDGPIADGIGVSATRLQRLLRALAAGALAAVALTAGLAGSGAGRAEAAEAPQPDPVTQTVRVILGATPTTVYVRATTYAPTAPGWSCASVWSARGRIGGTCSIGATFPVPVTIDPRVWPVGRTFAQVVDDATDVAVGNVTFDARRPSRFGVGYFEDRGQGDLYAQVPVTLYSAPLGRYIAQQYSPVQVQVAGRHGWVAVATLTTTRYGVASGVVHLGGGRHVIRAVRPDGATVWGTTGRNRLVTVTTEPLDVI